MLNELAVRCFELAKEKGFEQMEEGNEDFHIPRDLMLIVSELGEAIEALRNDKLIRINKTMIEGMDLSTKIEHEIFEKNIKDTFEDEIADTFIRLLHLCGMLGIDIDTHIRLKLTYNATRPNGHGKKF